MITDDKIVKLRARLRNRELTFGSWLQLASPDVAEIMSTAGFDWLVIDMEHGAIDRSTLVPIVRAIESRERVPFARIMSCDPLLGRQALDAGCAGIIIPHVESPEEYATFVDKCCWPPEGSRSIGFFRANDYGLAFTDYAAIAQIPILIPMIESLQGVQNLQAILAESQVDAVLVGPYDLSASLGVPGDFQSSSYREALDSIIDTCKRFEITVGIHDVTPSSDSIEGNIARGFTFIACGMDTVFLSSSATNIAGLKEIRRAQST